MEEWASAQVVAKLRTSNRFMVGKMVMNEGGVTIECSRVGKYVT